VLALIALSIVPIFSETYDSPASQCHSVFAGGSAPSNVPSPNHGTLVPECHTNDGTVFFYTVYDPSVFHALLSAQHIDHSQLSRCNGGRRGFDEDPVLKQMGVAQLDPMAASSGYTDQWNRGHLSPSEVFSYDKSADGPWVQCYYTSNIAPQWFQVNQIGWRLLEANVFHWSELRARDVYVITGAWYDGSKLRKFSSGLAIPDFFYKIICDGTQSAAFAAQNVEGSTGMEAMDYMTVAAWQAKVGINFNLPSGCKTSTVNSGYWNFTHAPPVPYPPPANRR